jgi:hypothetical protein
MSQVLGIPDFCLVIRGDEGRDRVPRCASRVPEDGKTRVGYYLYRTELILLVFDKIRLIFSKPRLHKFIFLKEAILV